MMKAGILARRKLADDAFVPFVQEIVGEGSGSVAVPLGATSLVIQVWAPGGGGSRVTGALGYGAGAGAYSTLTVTIEVADAGKLLLWTIYPPGQGRKGSTGNGVSPVAGANGAGIASTTLANWIGDINAHQGESSTTTAYGGVSVASGGTTNTNGPAATSGTGALPANYPGNNVGKGGDGGFVSSGVQTDGQDGGPGMIRLSWS